VQGPKLRAFQVRVETGQSIGSDIVIHSGIHEGDRVITEGVQAVHDGSEITTANKPAAGGKAGDKKAPAKNNSKD
jgi:multidrug efflux pump subunit AcrA (membrane-fusion protein)